MLNKAKNVFLLVALYIGTSPHFASGAPPAPNGAHPRLFLDGITLQAWQTQVNVSGSVIRRAVDTCTDVQTNPGAHSGGGFAGFDFVGSLLQCLITYKATGSAGAKAAAFKYFDALLDDKDAVDDNLGGDTVVQHDTGYFVRSFAPYSALAYDWLHDEPEMTPALRTKALGRFKAWTEWYRSSGYSNDKPGTNYHAGWVFAATLIAVAEAGDAGADGEALWSYVVDTVWGSHMARALDTGGVLRDGEWLEGWQYGPLSVAEYAVAARALRERGITAPGLDSWLSSVLLRFDYAMLPGRNLHFIVGDNQATTPYSPIAQVMLSGIIAGAGNSTPKAQSRGLMLHVGSQYDPDLFGALAAATSGPAEDVSAGLPTTFTAAVAGNYYVRSGWDAQASYAAFQCGAQLVPDHTGHKATNFVFSRGTDDLVIDSQPYGAETLAANAVAVDFGRSPSEYSPFQSPWNQATHLDWTVQSTSGVSIARCNYRDAFRVTWEPTSTVQAAMRDFLFVPHGNNASVVLIDRVRVENPAHQAHLRFRSPGKFEPLGDRFVSAIGGSRLVLQIYATPAANPIVDTLVAQSYCDRHDAVCQLTGSRVIPASQVRLSVPQASKTIITVLDGTSTATTPTPATVLSGPNYTGVSLYRDNERVVVIASAAVVDTPPPSLAYDVEANGGLHVVLDSPANGAALTQVSAVSSAVGCRVTVTPATGSAGFAARPLMFRLTPTCAVVSEGTSVQIDPQARDQLAPHAPSNVAALWTNGSDR
jgi:hypothetical protein